MTEFSAPPIAACLRRAAAALEFSFMRLTTLDAELADTLPDDFKRQPGMSTVLQELDRATQEIAGIALFLEDLAAATRADGTFEQDGLTQRQTLEELAGRLRGEAPAPEPQTALHGGYELF